MKPVPQWVQQARNFPLRFCQVREDPTVDLWVIRQLPERARILMIGSGGCTVAALTQESNVTAVHVIDPNPAQLQLGKLKLYLRAQENVSTRLKLLGHATMPVAERGAALAQIFDKIGGELSSLGPIKDILNLGPDYCGRYEAIFRAIKADLLLVQTFNIKNLLSLKNAAKQKLWLVEHPTFEPTLATIFEQMLELSALQSLFGQEATRNRATSFSNHFHQRTMWCLKNFDAGANPYLWQMLYATYPPNVCVPWLTAPTGHSSIHYEFSVATIQEYLKNCCETFNFVHLSNVLDWLSEEDARTLLERTWKRLSPGGFVLIRQLNSNLAIRSLGQQFTWLAEDSERLLANDRSFFYCAMHLGQKPLS